jgi:chromosomal replication initiation ATPase DnaA
MTAGPNLKPAQLVLELPHRQALGAEDFLVSSSNAAALQLIDAWPGWTAPAAFVVGPEGSGKSHLAHVWRMRSGARVVGAAALDDAAIGELEAASALVIEDIDRGLGSERALFHLLNLAREERFSILLTARKAPGEIAVTLPDLRSRLRAVPVARIEAPDDALLKAVLVKLFADRQLMVEPQLVSYLALHVERSLAGAARVVAAADRLSLSRQRKVTKAIAAEALELGARGEVGERGE